MKMLPKPVLRNHTVICERCVCDQPDQRLVDVSVKNKPQDFHGLIVNARVLCRMSLVRTKPHLVLCKKIKKIPLPFILPVILAYITYECF